VDSGRLRSVTAMWGLDFEGVAPGVPLQGSPERSEDRVVIRADGGLYLLEELAPASVPRKRVMAARLAHLAAQGLAVAAPCSARDGEHIQTGGGRYWQLSPFIAGEEPDRGTYWREVWRGQALARYLADMRRAAQGLELNEPPFDLHAYVRRIEADTRKLHPAVHDRLFPVFRLLGSMLAACRDLPVVFCHGDPHPLNVIWGRDSILAVIDWEFCGPKCVLYDIALILGCVGSEDETALDGPFARAFLETLRSEGMLDADLQTHLPVWTLALRTAWLAEWLRQGDTDSAEFEVFYMTVLADRFF
jgi:homoserine kinase type II